VLIFAPYLLVGLEDLDDRLLELLVNAGGP
jgi:hypothetical protein